jgi:hypothetical protein
MVHPVWDVNICAINDTGCVCVCPPYYHNRTKSTSIAPLDITRASTEPEPMYSAVHLNIFMSTVKFRMSVLTMAKNSEYFLHHYCLGTTESLRYLCFVAVTLSRSFVSHPYSRSIRLFINTRFSYLSTRLTGEQRDNLWTSNNTKRHDFSVVTFQVLWGPMFEVAVSVYNWDFSF